MRPEQDDPLWLERCRDGVAILLDFAPGDHGHSLAGGGGAFNEICRPAEMPRHLRTCTAYGRSPFSPPSCKKFSPPTPLGGATSRSIIGSFSWSPRSRGSLIASIS